MIDRSVYEIDYILELQKRYDSDPGLIERALYAFELLEAITRVGMPFCFKGGTSLMLILDKPLRLSTDIDILVEPGIDVDKYINEASKIFPFINKKEVVRIGKNGIIKRHFKFFYYSPIRKTEFFILLDIVFTHLPYAKTIHKEINNELLLTREDNLSVQIPTADCILADKLTAFAPHTTGVPLGINKELEIAKQLFDIGTLTDYFDYYELFSKTYEDVAKEETAFRGENWSLEEILQDTIRSCVSIISKGMIDKEDYYEYLRGIKALKNHVLNKGYNTDDATWKACKVMYLASCLLSGNPFRKPVNPDEYISSNLEVKEYKRLAYVRKQNSEAYAYLIKATKNIKNIL